MESADMVTHSHKCVYFEGCTQSRISLISVFGCGAEPLAELWLPVEFCLLLTAKVQTCLESS